jgi:hypothetical protein
VGCAMGRDRLGRGERGGRKERKEVAAYHHRDLLGRLLLEDCYSVRRDLMKRPWQRLNELIREQVVLQFLCNSMQYNLRDRLLRNDARYQALKLF